MKNSFCVILLAVFAPICGAVDVHGLTVGYVYQLDSSDPTAFEFSIPERPHACGSDLYRSYSPSEAVANRKFSLIVAAFMGNKKLSLSENGVCEGDRVKVGWIRLTN